MVRKYTAVVHVLPLQQYVQPRGWDGIAAHSLDIVSIGRYIYTSIGACALNQGDGRFVSLVLHYDGGIRGYRIIRIQLHRMAEAGPHLVVQKQ